MKQTVNKFVFSLMLLASPVFVGCSESDGPEDPAAPKTEFRLTADDLNTHLPGGIGESSIYLMGPDGAHIYKCHTPRKSFVCFLCRLPM